MSLTIYQLMGGQPTVDAAVDVFYDRVMEDPDLVPFFADMDLEEQKAKQAQFLSFVFGGPADYDGPSLRQAHHRLVAAGMTEYHFDAVLAHLRTTLEQLSLESTLVDRALLRANETRQEILGR